MVGFHGSAVENQMTKIIRFQDLKTRGIVSNWNTLLRWIEHENFPPGRRLGANTRVWTETEIEDWIASRPVASIKEASDAA
jgi:predicted DNA-binding transcriptional regulator AlpA